VSQPRIVDVAIAIALAVLALLPIGVPALELGYLPDRTGTAASVLLALAQTLPLAARRRMPAAPLLVVGLAFAATQLLGSDTGLAGLGLLVALYSAGRHARRQRWLAGASAAAYALLAIALASAGSPERPIDWVTFGVVLAAPWAAGMLVRTQVDRQREQQTLAAARAVSDARSAIARDLHDVVTHHVTAMVLQAESTAFATEQLGDDDRAHALTTIGGTGRSALRELRALLDALDPATAEDGRFDPARVDVAALVRRLQDTGYPVTLEQDAALQPGPVASATLHDVAREALTNAMKHAPGIPVQCVLREVDGALELVVANRMPVAPVGEGSGGRGSAIMAERMREAGGTLRACVDGGSFLVTARLPR
jgi:signal transduction histidine kinase